MQTSTNGVEHVESPPNQPIQKDLDQDNNHDNVQAPPFDSILAQASIDDVAPDPKTKKLSLDQRLVRLSKYRIQSTSVRATAKPNGKGGNADVVRASFKRRKGARGKRVAVKKIRYSDATDEEKFSKEFVHEVELLAGLSHENIVELVGFVEDLEHQKAWIVLSWEPNGNVREFLASGKWEIPERISLVSSVLSWGMAIFYVKPTRLVHFRLKTCFEASGTFTHANRPYVMEILNRYVRAQSCGPRLKPSRISTSLQLNILVNSSCRAVITDFGSARVLRSDNDRPTNQEKMRNAGEVAATDEGDNCPEVTLVALVNQLTLTGPLWSLRWAAPELVKEETRPGLASDIWSAGWVCWEMMTDRVPFEDLIRDCAVMLKVIQGRVPMIKENGEVAQVMSLCSLMTDCWKYKPEDRPH
ncbi:hypothetical protein FS837_006354, partial [Tulasnella sp. UAMH 9824]